jgi:hypothetical protein
MAYNGVGLALVAELLFQKLIVVHKIIKSKIDTDHERYIAQKITAVE